MTYEKLFELKFKNQLATHELKKKYPKDREKISQIALMELSTDELKMLVKQEELRQLLFLKFELLKKTAPKSALAN